MANICLTELRCHCYRAQGQDGLNKEGHPGEVWGLDTSAFPRTRWSGDSTCLHVDVSSLQLSVCTARSLGSLPYE